MRGEGSIEFGGALVVEAAAALVVEDVSGVFCLGDGDEAQVGAAGEPPADLAVEVLDLAALPRGVRVAEPDLQVVVVGEAAPVRPFGAAVEGQRAPQVRRDAVEALDEAGEDRSAS